MSAMSEMDLMEVDICKERDEEITKIVNICYIIAKQAGTLFDTLKCEMESQIIDIDISDEIAGILKFVFKCLQKEENDPQGYNKYLAHNAKLNGITISIQAIVEKIKAENIKLSFIIATPIIEIMTIFKSMYSEVRTGVTRLRVRKCVLKKSVKRDASGRILGRELAFENLTRSISQYGLSYHHIPLLQGISFAAERRTEDLHSLGPLTQSIMAIGDKYNPKLISALTNSLQMLPMSSEIISCLSNATSPYSVSGVLKHLGDILLLTTTRSTQNISMPLLLILHLWAIKPSGFQWSFLGGTMTKFYSEKAIGMKFKIKSGACSLLTSEALFHAMFGTYLEDLSVLQQITNYAKWHQRKEMNSVFYKRGEQNQVTVKPITFKYVSKNSQAMLTKRHGKFNSFATSRPSFAGFRKRHFSQEFLSYMTGKDAISFTSDPCHLNCQLKKFHALIAKKDSLDNLLASDMKWELFKDGAWEQCDFVPTKGNIKFFGM